MKRLLCFILIWVLALRAGAGVFDTNAPILLTPNWASYSTGPYLCYDETLATFLACMLPDRTNCTAGWGRSGGEPQDDWKNEMFKKCGPFWADWTNGPIYNIFNFSENGGYSTNAILQWATNLINATTATAGWWNNGYTNEGVTFPTITYCVLGAINENAYTDPNANLQYAQAAHYLTTLGWPVLEIPTWYLTYTNGLNNDTNHYFGYFSGQHPFRGGGLSMGLWTLQTPVFNCPTNIWSMTVDFNGATVTTANHITAGSVTRSGNTLTINNWRCDRMAGGWDYSGTNNANTCFAIFPMLANMFQQSIRVTNLPPGTYTAYLDGQYWFAASDAQLSASGGVNTFTNFNGPLGAQRTKVLMDQRDAYGLDHVTLQQVGQTGPLGPNLIGEQSNSQIYPASNTGTNYLAVMKNTFGWPGNYYNYAIEMNHDAQQTNHTFTLVLTPPTYAPFRIADFSSTNNWPDVTWFNGVPWTNDVARKELKLKQHRALTFER